MKDSTDENFYPYPSKKPLDATSSTSSTGVTARTINGVTWTTADTPSTDTPSTVSPSEFPCAQVLWDELVPLLQAQKIPTRRYKKRFFELQRDVDRFWLYRLWVNRFTETYFKASSTSPRSKVHRADLKRIFTILEARGAEYFIDLYNGIRLAAFQDELAEMRVRYEA